MTCYAATGVTTLRYPLSGTMGDDLVARVVAGDRAAFISIYREHFPEVRAFAERLLGCSMTAEDVVHDVFLRLPAALAGFRGECALRSFIMGVAVRVARDHIRSASRRRAHEQHAQPSGAAFSRPDASAEQRELAALLSRALEALPLDQRIAFVLCEVEERTSTEAAELLGVSDSTLRSRVLLAKRKLRQKLAHHFADGAGR